jgi:hypothetical protein
MTIRLDTSQIHVPTIDGLSLSLAEGEDRDEDARPAFPWHRSLGRARGSGRGGDQAIEDDRTGRLGIIPADQLVLRHFAQATVETSPVRPRSVLPGGAACRPSTLVTPQSQPDQSGIHSSNCSPAGQPLIRGQRTGARR